MYLSRISRELSCLSSGLPSAFLRSLFNSSTARIYSPCSSPAGYVVVTNLDSGFTRSTSDAFFNGTEINVAISARESDILNQKNRRLATNEHKQQRQVHFLDSDRERHITSWDTEKRTAQNQDLLIDRQIFICSQIYSCDWTPRQNYLGSPRAKINWWAPINPVFLPIFVQCVPYSCARILSGPWFAVRLSD